MVKPLEFGDPEEHNLDNVGGDQGKSIDPEKIVAIADLRKPRFLRRGFLFDGRFIRPRQRRPPEQEDRADRDAKGRTLVRP